LEGAQKKVLELETKNFNYQNELLELHNWIVEIGKIMGLINLEQAAMQKTLEQK